MTLNEAKATIYANVVYACEKAGLAPQTTRLVQDACDTIIALADRKTENSSENRTTAILVDLNYIVPKCAKGVVNGIAIMSQRTSHRQKLKQKLKTQIKNQMSFQFMTE